MAYAAFSVVFGETPSASKWNILGTNDAAFNSGGGVLAAGVNAEAWTAFTPQIDQGVTTNIAKTVTSARYIQYGKVVYATVRVDFTGAGTAGSAITSTIPVNAKNGTSFICLGTSNYYDTSVGSPNYHALVLTASASQVQFIIHSTTGSIGVVPNIAVASGDMLSFSVTYEAA